MDSDRQDFEKSLPGMGIPKWMKNSEKFNYGDFCQSPPSHEDGFFHFSGQTKSTHQARVTVSGQGDTPDCVLRKVDKEPELQKGPISSGVTGVDFNKAKDCKAPETSNFFRTVSSSSLVNMANSRAVQLMHPITNQKNVAQIGNAGNLSDSSYKSTSMNSQLNMYKGDSDISAPTALESTFPNQIKTRLDFERGYSAMKSSDTKHRSNNKCVRHDKMEKSAKPGKDNKIVPADRDDVTPNTTPAVTPSSSPQLSRRNENPFFTGSTQSSQSAAGKSSGSWLFRSSTSAVSEQNRGFGNILYEVPTDSNAKTRYVPKPSQLRELNFWSPTSM